VTLLRWLKGGGEPRTSINSSLFSTLVWPWTENYPWPQALGIPSARPAITNCVSCWSFGAICHPAAQKHLHIPCFTLRRPRITLLCEPALKIPLLLIIILTRFEYCNSVHAGLQVFRRSECVLVRCDRLLANLMKFIFTSGNMTSTLNLQPVENNMILLERVGS